jgi:arsenite-transporting ATPase
VTRIILFTGKGGVGKTTVAAATGLRIAGKGARTLVVSTDPAHSLGDALDMALADRPTPVTTTLAGQELDARVRLEDQWGDLRRYLSRVLNWAGVDAIESEELTLLPGLEEVLALTDLVRLSESGDWDVIVVDCAPTAETLRFLSLPEVLSWWMERLFPLGRQVTRVVAPVVRQISAVPIPDEVVFGAVDELYHRMGSVKNLLADREQTSVRLVVNPERVVVAEARRTCTYLSLFGFGVDAVVVNRLLPSAVSDPWFDKWRLVQTEQLDAIVAGFAPVPVLQAELCGDEPIGVDALVRLADQVYGEHDAAARLHTGSVLEIESHRNGLALTLQLPFGHRRDVGLSRKGGELFVSVGPYRRAIVLPDSLARRQVVDAAVRDGQLTVVFAS